MKKLLTSILLLSIFTTNAYAVTTKSTVTPSVTPAASPTGTPTPTDQMLQQQQIDELKNKIASRVAQLHLVGKKGVIGTVTDVAETQLSITDIHGNTVFIDVDELTKFSSPNSKSIGISDITKGTTIGVLGLYNKESQRILARFIDIMNTPQILNGAVTGIDKDNYNVDITTLKQKDIVVSIENITKTYVYSSTTGLTRGGFSKIQQGQRVVVVGFPDTKDKNTIIASRVLVLPSVPVNPNIVLVKPEELGVTPSTGSGTKLVPIIKKQ